MLRQLQQCHKTLILTILHFRSELLAKAVRRLDCPAQDEERGAQGSTSASSAVYWNALSSLSGVLPQKLIERLQQTRQEIDGLSSNLHKLEVSYELNAD